MIFEGALSLLLAAAPTPADTAAARELLHAPVATATDTATEVQRAGTARRACARLDPGDMLRIDSAAGRFEGCARRMTATGFEELDPNSGWAPAPVIRWEQVERVDVRRSNVGSSAAKGAIIGAAVVGVAYVLALASQGWTSYSDGPSATMFVAILSIPAILTSTAIGGAIGGANARWDTVYPVP